MSEVPGADRDQERDNVVDVTPVVPESVEDAEDDPRSTDEPTYRGDDGGTGEGAKPPAGSTELNT